MGRLSEFVNGTRRGTRPSYLNSATSVSGDGVTVQAGSDSDYVQVSGFVENEAMFDHLLTTDPGFDLNVRSLIRKVLQKARRNLTRDAAAYIKNDPRKAARAVKHTVYKKLFGGNLSILQKRKAGAKCEYNPPRRLQAGQRGGNRLTRSARTKQIDSYYGADRGFILRFMASGTSSRQTRFGNRGSIRQTDWFGHTAPWQMESAAAEVAEAINEYVKHKTNG